MKTIKIFIASSNELEKERLLMASLANELSTRLEKVGIQVIAVEWESLDASMGEDHKQEEYNDKLRECDMCMVLYWTKFGMYTEKELNTAYHEKIAGKNPQKVWVYFKEVDDPSNQPTEELIKFRDSFPTKYGHFYTPFANFDTLKAHFLLQFMEYQSQTLEGKGIVEVIDGKVTVDGKEYVDLQDVPFAGNNEEYNATKKSISDKQNLLQFVPTDNPLYSQTAEELRQLQEKLSKMESSLWDTALWITKQNTQKSSERLQRAMDLFSNGDNKGAMAILNEEEIEKDIQHNLNLIKLGEEGKKGLNNNIDELLFKAKTYKTEMTDGWVLKRCKIYDRIIQLSESLYGENSEKTVSAYVKSGTAYRYLGDYDKALSLYLRAMEKGKIIFGEDHPYIAVILDRIADIHIEVCNYPLAQESYKKSLKIRKEKLGAKDSKTARSYFKIGFVYERLGDYANALKNYKKNLHICLELYGNERPATAAAYNCIGNVYGVLGEYSKALECHRKSLDIRIKTLGYNHSNIAYSYLNLGLIKERTKNYISALNDYQMSMNIREKVLGHNHPSTAISYGYIGNVYLLLGNFSNALKNLFEALSIQEKTFGSTHHDTAQTYRAIGQVYRKQGRYPQAHEYYDKALNAFLKLYDSKHTDIAWIYNSISELYFNEGIYPLSLKYEKKCLSLLEDILGLECIDTAKAYGNVSRIYMKLCDYEQTFNYLKKAIAIFEKQLGANHQHTANAYNELAWDLHLTGRSEEALPWAEKAVAVFPKTPYIIDTLASVYQDLCRYDEALEQFDLCLKLKHEQKESDDNIHETEDKIAALKELMKNGGVSEQ